MGRPARGTSTSPQGHCLAWAQGWILRLSLSAARREVPHDALRKKSRRHLLRPPWRERPAAPGQRWERPDSTLGVSLDPACWPERIRRRSPMRWHRTRERGCWKAWIHHFSPLLKGADGHWEGQSLGRCIAGCCGKRDGTSGGQVMSIKTGNFISRDIRGTYTCLLYVS
eukprot:1368144-Amorphochlora_amoeboformis.AAC.1